MRGRSQRRRNHFFRKMRYAAMVIPARFKMITTARIVVVETDIAVPENVPAIESRRVCPC